MPADRAIFQDEQGRGWLVEIQYGHPAPTERGIFAARFICPEDPLEAVRLGYLYQAAREALAESEPARSVG